MEQESATTSYSYFDRSHKVELALFLIFGPVLLTLWAVTCYVYYVDGQVWMQLVRLAAYSSVTLICALILYGNTRAIRRAGAVVVGREQIVKKGAGGMSALKCADIRGVRRSGMPFLGRWVILESPQKPFRLPLYIRDGHEMVEKIFAILEERGFSFDGAAGLKARLCSAAKRNGALYALRAGHLPNLFRAAAAAAVFNGAVAALFWDCTFLTTILWGFMSMLLQTLAYFAAERFYLRKVLDGEDDGSFAGYCALSGILALLFGMAVFGMFVGVLVTGPA